jgi:hypothetical protein
LNDLWLFAALGALTAVSLSIAAFRCADASTLAPLDCVELAGAAFVGDLAFDEFPAPRDRGCRADRRRGILPARTAPTKPVRTGREHTALDRGKRRP